MKKKLIVIAAIFVLLLPFHAFAHSGRTDAYGGHNSPTGYHYHHGYPAHQHPNGTCIYNFDDRTGWNSGTSGSDKKQSAPKQNQTESDLSFSTSYIKYPFLAFCVFFPIKRFYDVKHSYFEEYNNSLDRLTKADEKKYLEEKQAAEKERYAIRKQQKKDQNQEREREKYQRLYGGKKAEDLAGMPDWIKIGEDGLPCPIDQRRNNEFYFCVSSKGNVLHTINCQHARGNQINAVKLFDRILRPCKSCKPSFPDLSWYEKYKKITSIKKKYNIE